MRRRRRPAWVLGVTAGRRTAVRPELLAVRTLAYACDDRDVTRLVRVLHPDAALVIDDGSGMRPQRRPITGRARIIDLLIGVLDRHPEAVSVECNIDGEPGIALHTSRDLVGVLTVAVRHERIAALRLIMDPDALRQWSAT